MQVTNTWFDIELYRYVFFLREFLDHEIYRVLGIQWMNPPSQVSRKHGGCFHLIPQGKPRETKIDLENPWTSAIERSFWSSNSLVFRIFWEQFTPDGRLRREPVRVRGVELDLVTSAAGLSSGVEGAITVANLGYPYSRKRFPKHIPY